MSTPCIYTGVDVLTQDERDLLCAASTADKAGGVLGPAGLGAARQLAAYQLGSLKGGVFKINPAGGAAAAELLRAEAQASLRMVDVAPRATEGTVEALATLCEGRSVFEALIVEAHKRGITLKFYPDGRLVTVWVAVVGDGSGSGAGPMARTDGAEGRACQWSTATGPDLERTCEAALDIVRRVPYVAPAAVPTESSQSVGRYLASVAALGCQFGSDTIGRCGARVVPGTTRCAAHPETWVIR